MMRADTNCPLYKAMKAIDYSYTPLFENPSLNALWESEDAVDRYIAKGIFFAEWDAPTRREMVYRWIDRQLWKPYQRIGELINFNVRAVVSDLHRFWRNQSSTFNSSGANHCLGYVSLKWSHGKKHDKGALRVWLDFDCTIMRQIIDRCNRVEIFANGEKASQLEIVWGIRRELRAALERSTWFDDL